MNSYDYRYMQIKLLAIETDCRDLVNATNRIAERTAELQKELARLQNEMSQE